MWLNAGHIIYHESARRCWPLGKPPLLKQPMNAPVWDLTQNHVAPCLPLTQDLWPLPLTRMLQTLLAQKEPIASHFPSWLWGLMVGDTDAAVTQHPKLLNVHICVNVPSIWFVMFIQSKSIYPTLHHQKSFFQFDFTPVINTTLSRNGSASSSRPVRPSSLRLTAINMQVCVCVCVGSAARCTDTSVLLTGASARDDGSTHSDEAERGNTYERFQGWVWNGRVFLSKIKNKMWVSHIFGAG